MTEGAVGNVRTDLQSQLYVHVAKFKPVHKEC